MVNKKQVIFGIFFGLIFINLFLVSSANEDCSVKSKAVCTLEGGQAVLWMTGNSNAHVSIQAKPLDVNYNNVLCCNFGNGNNNCPLVNQDRIVGVKTLTNSHAQTPDHGLIGKYLLFGACYDGLECVSHKKPAWDFLGLFSCPSGYDIKALSLSGESNSHAGNFQAYDLKVCCKFTGQSDEPTTNAVLTWQDSTGEVIDTINAVGTIFYPSSVFMNYTNPDFTSPNVNFDVYSNGELVDTILNVPFSSHEAVVSFEPDYTQLTESSDNFYQFQVDADMSSSLLVSETTNDDTEINSCADYTTQTDCEADPLFYFSSSDDSNPDCIKTTTQNCVWTTSCVKKIETTYEPPTCGDGLVCEYYDNIPPTQEGSCEDGDTSITLIYDSIDENPACQLFEEVSCPSTAELPFFDGYNFILALIILAGIYATMIIFEKNKNKILERKK